MTTFDRERLADQLEIRQLAADYARGVDVPDGKRVADLFLPDGVLRICHRGKSEPVGERVGREAIASAMDGLTRYEKTMHVVANQYIDLSGDSATGETYCLAHHIREVEGKGLMNYVMAIRYLDQYSRADEGWRIAVRELQVEFTEDRPVTGP
ncbi:MAG: nuclear transport factor 2 family protein [Mycobacterium sp.]|jgi:ketosteroid isomerase-like protein|nr:nuclear transport factor 2 family protein [Mycobacterium sp.]